MDRFHQQSRLVGEKVNGLDMNFRVRLAVCFVYLQESFAV